MRTLVISCSPRKGGNCDILTDVVKRNIDDADIYYTRDINCAACDGCGCCESAGICRHDDGATELYDKIVCAEAIVVIAPVYFYSFDAHTKAIIDRAQFLWRKPKAESIPLYLISCGGQSGENNFIYIQKVLLSWGIAVGAKYKDGLFFSSTDAAGEIVLRDGVERTERALIDWGLKR